jgi:predicted enzyme related to lactoylglutathione lyase
MRRTIAAILGFTAATWLTAVHADATVLAIRLGADDVVSLARFYETAFGLKAIDRVGDPPIEIIMRYGATAAEAKAGSSPEFLIMNREPGEIAGMMAHAIFHVSNLDATVAAAKAAGATMQGDVASIDINGMPVKIATLVDPDGNVLELMELPGGANKLPHP